MAGDLGGLAMIREARASDLATLEALMLRQIDQAMFPLSNLRNHGLAVGGFASHHDHATRFWFAGTEGLLALTKAGMLMPLLPDNTDLAGLASALAGQGVAGAVGPAASVRPVLRALGLDGRPVLKDADEPGFALDLVALAVPDRRGAVLVPASEVPRTLLVDWRSDYHREALGTPEDEASSYAERNIDGYLAQDSHRVLLLDGEPVAMTGFNATLPEIVQVGGVYTPPALRGRGHARTAVALHLAEARAKGVRRAVLFAANDAAAKAYLAIGFQPGQSFAIVIFADACRVPE
jgi:RimJ/RimL family protein N-acetyltransferase